LKQGVGRYFHNFIIINKDNKLITQHYELLLYFARHLLFIKYNTIFYILLKGKKFETVFFFDLQLYFLKYVKKDMHYFMTQMEACTPIFKGKVLKLLICLVYLF
jgi:hypothetical protein